VLQRYDFGTDIDDAIDNHDFDKDITKALDDYGIEGKIDDAVEEALKPVKTEMQRFKTFMDNLKKAVGSPIPDIKPVHNSIHPLDDSEAA
jgi:hypothetical protein